MLHRDEVHHGEIAAHDPRLALVEVLLRSVPPRVVHEQAVDQDAVFRRRDDVLRRLHPVQHLKGEVQRVNRLRVLPRVQPGEPVRLRVALPQPRVHELDPAVVVRDPAAEGLERRIRGFFPHARDLVVQKVGVHLLELAGHDDDALDRLLKLREGRDDDRREVVEPLDLLTEDDGQGFQLPGVRAIEEAERGFVEGHRRRDGRGELLGERGDNLVRRSPTLRGGRPGLYGQHRVHHLLRLLHLERDVRVRVHAENFRRLRQRQRVHEIPHALQIPLRRRVVRPTRREPVRVFQQSADVVLLQVAHQTATVEVVRDAPAVVDLTRHVHERGPRDLVLLLQKHLQREHGALDVGRVELVPDVPPERTEFPSLLNHRVEGAERVHELLVRRRLRARLPLLVVDVVKRSLHVRAHALRGLVRELNSVLEDQRGEDVRGHGREPQAMFVAHPVAGALPARDERLRDRPLPLPQRTDVQSLARDPPHLRREPLKHRGRVRARGEDEDDGRPRVGIREHVVQRPRRRLRERLPELDADVLLRARDGGLLAEELHDRELDERRELVVPTARERRLERGVGFRPGSERVRVGREVSREAVRDVSPHRVRGPLDRLGRGFVVQRRAAEEHGPLARLDFHPRRRFVLFLFVVGGGALRSRVRGRVLRRRRVRGGFLHRRRRLRASFAFLVVLLLRRLDLRGAQNARAQEEREQKLVLFEQPAAHGFKHKLRRVRHQVRQALVELVARLAVIDAQVKQPHEVRERVLVHRTYEREVGDDKVQDGAARRRGSVRLSRLVDVLFRLLGFDEAAADHPGGDFTVVQRVDEVDVVQDVPFGLFQEL
eukprot:31550-Pelagococcus_subviridis.AAC.10